MLNKGYVSLCNSDGEQHLFCRELKKRYCTRQESTFCNYWNANKLMSSLGERGLH